jgi:taurine dioxygenase
MAAFTFEELHPAVGVEIVGLDLSKELDSESVGTLRDLFDGAGLLLLRDAGLTPQDQAYLVGVVSGETAPADREAAVARTHIYANYVTNKDVDGYARFGELLFHCDMMWAETPTEVISLYGCRVEPPTVPTRFASMIHAIETLPADLRSRIADRRAVHETGQQRRGAHKDDLVVPQHEVLRSTVKPVIWHHPRTGRELLYTSQQMTARIEGLDPIESEALLEELFTHLYRPEAVLDHEWRQGDVVVWDNQALQHARGNVEIEGPERTLRKVIGPLPTERGIAKPKMVRAGAE